MKKKRKETQVLGGKCSDVRKAAIARAVASGRPLGRILADDGAVKAIMSGKALLPVGVLSVLGEFEKEV